jgi:transcription antitermination factor NusG
MPGEAYELEWYAVQTKWRREAITAAILRQQGMDTYAPRTREWPPPAVGRSIVPLFPGYIFVQAHLPFDHYCVMRTIGVRSFVGTADGPVRIDPAALEFLRRREDGDGVIHCGSPTTHPVEVEILKGPFRGLKAIVEERLPTRERIRVLLQILQREVPVEIPERWVRRT